MSDFTVIHFGCNLYSGCIIHKYDLNKIYKDYECHLTPDEIIDRSVNIPGSDTNFGLRREYTGEDNT